MDIDDFKQLVRDSIAYASQTDTDLSANFPRFAAADQGEHQRHRAYHMLTCLAGELRPHDPALSAAICTLIGVDPGWEPDSGAD